MSFKGKTNEIRAVVMHFFTKQLGQLDSIIVNNEHLINNVLICRPNGRLGNQILITPIVQEVSRLFPNSKIDLFVRGGAASAIFSNYQNVDQIIKLPQKPFDHIIQYIYVWYCLRDKKYDLVINIDNGSSSGKLSTKFAKSKRKIYGVIDKNLFSIYDDYMHMAKTPIYNLRKSLGLNCEDLNKQPIPLLNLNLSINEENQGKELLNKLVKNDKETICTYTYATGNKCYSKEWWKNMYELLVKKYGDIYNIIEILPKENVSQIDFKARTFYSRDIREMAALMKNSLLFIGADSGIMHLASSSNVATIGLFSITKMDRYQPYGRKNTAINTNGHNFEDILRVIDKTIRDCKINCVSKR